MLIICENHKDVFPQIVHKVVCVPRDAKASYVYPGCTRYGTKEVEKFYVDRFEGFNEVFASHELADFNRSINNPEGVNFFYFKGDVFDLGYILTGEDSFDVYRQLNGFDSGLLASFIEQLGPYVPNEGDLVLEDYWTINLQGIIGSFLETTIKSFNHDFSLLDPSVPETVSVGNRIVYSKGVKQEANA